MYNVTITVSKWKYENLAILIGMPFDYTALGHSTAVHCCFAEDDNEMY